MSSGSCQKAILLCLSPPQAELTVSVTVVSEPWSRLRATAAGPRVVGGAGPGEPAAALIYCRHLQVRDHLLQQLHRLSCRLLRLLLQVWLPIPLPLGSCDHHPGRGGSLGLGSIPPPSPLSPPAPPRPPQVTSAVGVSCTGPSELHVSWGLLGTRTQRGTLREADWSPDCKPTVIVEIPGTSKFLLRQRVCTLLQ